MVRFTDALGDKYGVRAIAGKGGSDWNYAWVPVAGPVIGGILGALCYRALWPA